MYIYTYRDRIFIPQGINTHMHTEYSYRINILRVSQNSINILMYRGALCAFFKNCKLKKTQQLNIYEKWRSRSEFYTQGDLLLNYIVFI